MRCNTSKQKDQMKEMKEERMKWIKEEWIKEKILFFLPLRVLK